MMQQSSPPDANADDHMDAFLYLVNHELKTPLTALKIYVELANRRAHKLDAQLNDAQLTNEVGASDSFDPLLLLLQRAENQANRLTQLVGDLVEAYTFRTEPLTIHRERCNLMDIVDACVTEQQHMWPTRTIRVKAPSRHTPSLLVMGDPLRLRQVINHYFQHAFTHAATDEPITIQVSHDRTMGHICVIDQHLSLSPASQAQLWDWSQPLASDIDASNGLEVGLYLSKQIIELHGGTVGVTSTARQGTSIWLTLPVCVAN